MNTVNRLLLIVLFGLFMATCQKEVSLDGPSNPNPGNDPATVTASVAGRVTNEYGEPVSGAMVKAGSTTAITNINGEFILSGAQVSSSAAFVTVNKTGYFEGSRTFRARQGHKHFVEIQLMPKLEVGSINSTSGGTINLGNGSSITLPANGIVVKSTGAAYTGAVKVSMAWIDPTSKDLFRQMPGDLRGIDAANSEVGMESYGMIGVELNAATGEKLQIATGKKATLKFPLPSSIQSSAPATIALWSFDEAKALWKQEGTATKSGSVYIADVSHFSWWNCDIPIATSANFTAKLVDQNGQGITGYHVMIYRSNGSYSGAHGYTDSSGVVTGRVPANESLVLKVEAPYPCNSIIHTQNIGPFALNSNNTIPNISVALSAVSTVTLTGTAQNCAGNPLTTGYIEIQSGWHTIRKNISNGSFSASFPKCGSSDITYFVVDETTKQQSTPVTTVVSPGTVNLGAISACGISTVEFLDYTFDNQSESLTVADSLMASSAWGSSFTQIGGGGPGTYIQFQFTGQGTGTFPVSGLFVIDNNNVMQQFNTPAQLSGVTIVITANGTTPGSFIEGSVSGVAVGNNGVSHPIQASFRIRKW